MQDSTSAARPYRVVSKFSVAYGVQEREGADKVGFAGTVGPDQHVDRAKMFNTNLIIY